MFGLETIRDALINFSAGTPSGQAYLANQREAAQQAQLFPLQLQMASNSKLPRSYQHKS